MVDKTTESRQTSHKVLRSLRDDGFNGPIPLERKLEILALLREEIQAAEENLDNMEINRLKLEARKLVEM